MWCLKLVALGTFNLYLFQTSVIQTVLGSAGALDLTTARSAIKFCALFSVIIAAMVLGLMNAANLDV